MDIKSPTGIAIYQRTKFGEAPKYQDGLRSPCLDSVLDLRSALIWLGAVHSCLCSHCCWFSFACAFTSFSLLSRTYFFEESRLGLTEFHQKQNFAFKVTGKSVSVPPFSRLMN